MASYIADKGIRGQSVGRAGVTHGILRSAVQKYIRRGEEKKAVRCAIEFDMFSEIGTSGEPIRTNMVNRLAIIAMEDIGPSNPSILPWIEQWRTTWKKDRNSIAGRIALVSMVRAMAASPKSRLTSHARSAYSDSTEAQAIAAVHGLKKPEGIDMKSLPVARYPDESGRAPHKYQAHLDRALSKRSDEAIFWSALLDKISLTKARDRSKKGIAAAWESILDAARVKTVPAVMRNAVMTLHKWHKELSGVREDFCFAVCAILMLNRRDSIPMEDEKYLMASAEEVEALYAIESVGELPLPIDDYCIDKHTIEGRNQGKGTAEFVTEGAKIANAAEWAHDDRYLAIYTELRTGCATESSFFSSPVRCQLTTSDSKTDSYLAKAVADGTPVFVKGPMDRDAVQAQIVADTLKARLTGMHRVGYRSVRAVPDLFSGTPLGRRRHTGKSPQYFLVAPDLFHPNGYVKLPTIFKKSKVWPNTAVYNRMGDKAAVGAHVDFLRPTVRTTVALCFRYVMGIGDTCGRNMLDTGQVTYSLDEDAFLKKYGPPRYGEQKRDAIVKDIGKFWPEVVAIISGWPDELAAVSGEQIKLIIAFMRPRVTTLVDGGPGPLFQSS